MEINLSEGCAECDTRPVCEIAAQKARKLEIAAKALGYTVTEGSLYCDGPRYEEVLDKTVCTSRLAPPTLASDEEREKIKSLHDLDAQTAKLLPDVRTLIGEIRA
jgi:hypothetical protein